PGSGGLTFIAQNNWTGSSPMETGFALNAANSFSGPVEIQRGSVYLGNASSLIQGNLLTFNTASGNNARLFLYGRNAVISDLASAGAGAAVIANGNLKTGASLTLGAVTVQSGGTLAPGDSGLGLLTINNSLSLAGSVVMEVSKSSGNLTSDQVGGISALNYGGTLIVTNVSPGGAVLASGDTFTVFT